MPVSVTYNNEFPYSNMTDYSLSEESSPENHAQGGQTTALDIVLDTDHLDYSVLGNVEPDLNILLDNNSINCRYFTEMEFNNNSFIDTNFSLFNLNIRSLPKNYVNLQHFIEGLNISFSVLSFTETWLSEYNTSIYNFKGYSHIYKLRDKRRGGGVSMFINNKLNFQVRNDITFNLKNIDFIAIEMKDELNTKRNVIILTIYHPPDVLPNLFNDKLNDLLQMLNQENKTIFVTGDFNINTSDAIINPNTNVNNFQNIFLSYLYTPLIDKHTRVDKKRGTSTMLDNIYSNVTQITNTIHSGVFKTDYSDHYSIFCVTDLVIRHGIQNL